MAEGLYRPDQLAVPFSHERVLHSLVRIRTRLYFAVTLFATEAEAVSFRTSLELPLGYQKVALAEGVILWYLVLSLADLRAIRTHPGQQLMPAFYEALQALADAPEPPAQRIVPFEGQGTGFFIAADGRILTNYHVAREEIDPAGRAEGALSYQPCRYLTCDTLIVEGERVAGYQALLEVGLLANLSADDWRAGWDAALLQAPGQHPFLTPAADLPAIGDEVWSYGFPMRSRRPETQREALGYEDADHSLRVSHGQVTGWLTDHTFVADLDGLSGSSGGPVLNQHGEVVGLVRDVYPKEEATNRPLRFRGGMVCVAVQPALARLAG